MIKKIVLISCILLLIILVSSCGSKNDLVGEMIKATPSEEIEPTITIIPSATLAITPKPTATTEQPLFSVEIGNEVPEFFGKPLKELGLLAEQPLQLKECEEIDGALWSADYVFAVTAQFPTVLDVVTIDEVQALWTGNSEESTYFQQLLVDGDYEPLFTSLWGSYDDTGVLVIPSNYLTSELWEREDRIAIVPFEQIEPQMKVLTVAGQNPMMKSFDKDLYPLAIQFCLTGDASGQMSDGLETIPTTNRDPDKMTTLLMTGVTALTRETAYKMEQNGVLYPAKMIMQWFNEADFVHISNKVAFTEECPVPEPPFSASRFCSRPDYFELLEYIGANIIELTGNHLLDYGEDAFQEMMSRIQDNELDYYGGGVDFTDASQPLLITHNENRLVFLGCNVPGPDSVFASGEFGGALPCDMDKMVEMVQSSVASGLIPIVTIQHYESCQVTPISAQYVDMTRLAEAGAVIVSGSQAHCPQTMTFVGGNFVHYGLGNLFFDQMWDWYRNAFLDYHVFYDGRYLGTQLLTTRLEDASQPRPMTEEEREAFLENFFSQCIWEIE